MSELATRILWLVLLWCLCCAPATGKEYWTYKTAHDAYDSGEFQLAADIYKRLAKKGNARAQNDLGFLYSVGHGVEQDFKTAALWFHKAARQGHAAALFHLAEMHEAGRGVGQSAIEAHKFYNLASLLTKKANERHIAVSRRDELARQLTPAQLTTARNRACRWWRTHNSQTPRKLPDCAAD